MDNKSIILADSQYLICLSLKKLVNEMEGFEVIDEAQNETNLLTIISASKEALIVLDYQQPGYFEKDTVSKVLTSSPDSKILIISSDTNKQNIYDVLELGVNGYITKQCGEEEIINAIKATSKGEKFFCNNVLNFILQKSFSPEEDDCSPTPLTLREIQVVKLIAAGKIAKEIASELDLSTHTVYTHRKNIMKKLSINSTSELILYALDRGIITTTPSNT